MNHELDVAAQPDEQVYEHKKPPGHTGMCFITRCSRPLSSSIDLLFTGDHYIIYKCGRNVKLIQK